MNYDRRKFLRSTGLLASGIAFGSLACNTSATKEEKTDGGDSTKTDSTKSAAVATGTALTAFGLQLYTLRDDLPKDPKGILKQVASFGYKQVEGFEGAKGMFWGMKHTDFKKYLDELGITMISSHCDFKKDFEKKAAQAGEIGMKYLIAPYLGPQKSIDDFKKYAETFNKCGDVCKKHGLRFAYHNHDYSFKDMGGDLPQDVMMQGTNPATVDFEMDIYWVVTAGQDPEAWLKKYFDRWRLCHIKDRSKTAKPEEQDASVDVGTGSINFAKVLKTAKENGMEYFIVEQEKYDNSTPLKSAEADAAYLKTLLI